MIEAFIRGDNRPSHERLRSWIPTCSASGKDLEEKWEIKYLGPETLDGVKTEKLELVAKDPAVRKNIPKVNVWMDAEQGISLKQVFDEGPGQSRVCVYFNRKVNQTLPGDAFTFKTDSKTQFVNR